MHADSVWKVGCGSVCNAGHSKDNADIPQVHQTHHVQPGIQDAPGLTVAEATVPGKQCDSGELCTGGSLAQEEVHGHAEQIQGSIPYRSPQLRRNLGVTMQYAHNDITERSL